jgi:hypothetical protein
VSENGKASFTLHAWDNDDPSGDRYGSEFDDVDNADELLVGFRREFGLELPTGVEEAGSPDLAVRFRVTRSIGGIDAPAFPCGPPDQPANF